MSERQKFEENWKSAFDGAETTPPDRVWSSIELDLAAQESAAMKRRVIYWQRMAAALLLFALLTGVYAFYPRGVEVEAGDRSKEAVVRRQETGDRSKETGDRSKETGVRSQETGVGSQENGNSVPGESAVAKSDQSDTQNDLKSISQSFIAVNTVSSPYIPKSMMFPPTLSAKLETKSVLPETIAATIDEDSVDKAEEQIAVVSPLLEEEQPEEIVKPKKRVSESNLWIALGAAAGNYSPNTPSAVTNSNVADYGTLLNPAVNAQNTQKSEPKVGTSYSFGLAVGKKFGRVVVQTGINVGKQQIEYSSNYSVQTASNSAKAASSDYLKTEAQSYVMSATNPYTVNSTMEIVSVPVQAGYMIIDRKLGWQMNAGVSPDFFIRNILTDQSGQREKFTQSAGSESPYRSVNWSGLLNTELSYRIGSHYRISLVPGVRYSFNSILKEPSNNGRPVIIDVGFRFRYLFE